MSYEFPNGGNFRGERHHMSRLKGEKVRQAINDTGSYLVGAAIVMPDVETFAQATGVHRSAFYREPFGSFEEGISHVTGLAVMTVPGLIILENDTSVTPLSDIPT